MEDIKVSVVIVCMNNYGQLKACLDSIHNHTSVNIEVLVVAYMFSQENLERLQTEYTWVKIILSNELRGFSANNNLAFKKMKGEYCFVLNDDTYFNTPVIDELAKTLESHKEIALVSPQILRPDGTVQYSGIPPITWIDWLMILFKFKKERVDHSGNYIQYKGLFKTYNILGAAFLIRSNIFRKMGYFDERYFFGPEDKALSTLLNKKGYSCYVNADIKIYHLGGATGGALTKTVCATRPSERKGSVIMYSEGKRWRYLLLSTLVWINSALWACGWLLKTLAGNSSAKYSLIANINVCRSIFSNKTTTEIFKQYYQKR